MHAIGQNPMAADVRRPRSMIVGVQAADRAGEDQGTVFAAY